jgi:hypothetical protein
MGLQRLEFRNRRSPVPRRRCSSERRERYTITVEESRIGVTSILRALIKGENMPYPIYWQEFTWEAAGSFAGAIATLLAGVAAVIGAVIIGLRQVKLMEAQHRVEKLKLKAELFKNRYDIFVEFGVILEDIASGRDVPDGAMTRIRQNVDRSIFLFDASVHDHLKPLLDAAIARNHANRLRPFDGNASAQDFWDARQGLYQVFEPWLKLDDSLL